MLDLTSAALGGKSTSEDEVGLDSGDGLEEMTEDGWKNLITMLGKDCWHQYPDYTDTLNEINEKYEIIQFE